MNDIEKVLWVSNQLFNRNLITGSSGNISFKYQDKIYITPSGSCIGLLRSDSFAQIDMHGSVLNGKPSKEWPLHLKFYQDNPYVNAVIHTHSYYSTLYSCVENCEEDYMKLFSYTPYLNMKTNGNIGFIDYHPPGTKELFDEFNKKFNNNTLLYFLKNHGSVIAGKDILDSFYITEELEQTCKIVLSINNYNNFSTITE